MSYFMVICQYFHGWTGINSEIVSEFRLCLLTRAQFAVKNSHGLFIFQHFLSNFLSSLNLRLVSFLYLVFLSDLFDFFVVLAFLSTIFLSFFSLVAPLVNIAQICRYRRQTTLEHRDGYHFSNFFHGVHFHSERKQTIIPYIQGVPGVNTSGFNSVADAESKASYTHMWPIRDSSGFTSFQSTVNKLDRKEEHCSFIEICCEMYSYRFAVQHSNKLFEVSFIRLDTFSDECNHRTCNLTKHCSFVDFSSSAENSLE